MKILLQNRDHSQWYGGDQALIESLQKSFQGLGHEALYSPDTSIDLTGVDMVHLWHLNFPWTIEQARNCKKQKVPYVITTIFYDYLSLEHLVEIVDGAKWVISNSNNERQEVIHAYYEKGGKDRRDKFLVVQNGIRDDYMRYNVFTAGRYEEFKNQLLVIQACKQLGLPVVCAGGVGHWSYKALCEREQYGTLLGQLSEQEMLEQYDKARVYVCASRTERASVCATEAKARGCALVVTEENRANPELKPQYTITPGNVDDLVAKIKAAYEDYPLSATDTAREYLKLYQSE